MTTTQSKRLMGIDPGLRYMGWGVIDVRGSRLSHVANGAVSSNPSDTIAERLANLYRGLAAIIEQFRPEAVAVEKTFVNKGAVSTLKLGQARGIAMLVPALATLPVAEYAPNVIKKSLIGAGHANKTQIRAMVEVLLPRCDIASEDAADALALAICHAHYASTAERIASALADGDALSLPKGHVVR